MPDILQDFPIRKPARVVFEAITSPRGLDAWWTLSSAGQPRAGSEYTLGFGPGYDWRARVSRVVENSEFELEMIRSDADWDATRVGFLLEERDGATWVRFHHRGWKEANAHFRISAHCWALYLRILRRFLEHGERVEYERRLDV
jgi:uncharacterized protein YndB with AHSA1/START domain